MRLRFGSLLRTSLLAFLLYLIFLMTRDDESGDSVKNSILNQFPNNHYHQKREQRISDDETSPAKAKSPSNNNKSKKRRRAPRKELRRIPNCTLMRQIGEIDSMVQGYVVAARQWKKTDGQGGWASRNDSERLTIRF